MDKEKEVIETTLSNSYTPSRVDHIFDAGRKMLDDAKNEELSVQPAQSEKQDKRED